MKQVLLPALAATLLLSSCGNDAKVKSIQKNEDGSTTTTTVDMEAVNKLSEASDEMTKKSEALKKLTPLNLDQLKALLPNEVGGIKRTDFQANSAMGYATVEGEFRKDDSTDIKLMIYDCAGEAGSGIYMLTYWGAMNYQQESEREYTKTVEFKGGKAVEKYNKDSKESSLIYIASDRLLVQLTGHNVEPASLKEAAEGLDLKL